MAWLWGTFISLDLSKPITQVILYWWTFFLFPNVWTMFFEALRLGCSFLEHYFFGDSWYLSRVDCLLQSFLIDWSAILTGAVWRLDSLYEWMIDQLINIRPLARDDFKAAAEKTFQLRRCFVWECWSSICDSNHHEHASHWHSIRLPRQASCQHFVDNTA